METILVTGGSGLVGTELTKVLKERGYNVRHLVRDRQKANGKDHFFWDYENKIIDASALDGISFIINLSGANIGKRRWTNAYKKEIYDSRIASTNFLFEEIKKKNIPLHKFISASATGYYGDTGKLNLNEDDPAGKDFLANVCNDWEAASGQFKSLNVPVCIFRMGVVMTPKGGFVPTVSNMIKRGLGAHLGSGEQYVSWISLTDLCLLYLFAVQNDSLTGIFNATSSKPLKAKEIDDMIAKYYGKKIWLPNVPAFFLRLALGEMSSIILSSCHAENSKLKRMGFELPHENFEEVINDVC